MEISANCKINLPRLLDGRALIQANSGAGKSHLLRKILEETAGHVQQLVIDPEGEFSTLREKYDFVICAPKGGDAVAHPATAALLARRLLELRVSAVLNIYDLKAHERQAFVRLFLDALVNSHKDLWHPVLIVLDEAHVFCPEKGKAESASAVIDIATRGRKRGFGLIMATQRLSKLHKDAAAEMINKAIGRTGLDIDVKRAADELGLPSRDAAERLRTLAPGEFFVFGPAFTETVQKIKVGPVKTTHPTSGGRLLANVPAPSARIREVLANGLQNIPKEAQEEARTLADIKVELAKTRAALTLAEKRAEKGGIPEGEVQKRIAAAVAAVKPPKASGINRIRGHLKKALEMLDGQGEEETRIHIVPGPGAKVNSSPEPGILFKGVDLAAPPPAGLRSGAVRILKELAARYPAGYSHAQVATLCTMSPKGGTFKTYIGDIKRAGYLEIRDGLVYVTESGIESLGGNVPKAPTSHAEVMAQWRAALRSGAFRMLEAVVENPDGIDRDSLAEAVQMEAGGGTFKTYLGDLRRNGLIEERDGVSRPSAILKPEGALA